MSITQYWNKLTGKNNMSDIPKFIKDDPVVLPDGKEATVIRVDKNSVLIKMNEGGNTKTVKPKDLTILWDKLYETDPTGWTPYEHNEYLTGTTYIQGTSPKKTYTGKSFALNCQHNMTEFKLKGGDSVYLNSLRGKYSKSTPTVEPPTVACYLDSGWLDQAQFWFTGDAPIEDDLYDASKTPTLYIAWRDMGTIPLRELSQAVVWCLRRVKEGERLAIGCHGAHGRTGTLLACLLVHEGDTATEAINKVRKEYCTKAIETKGQEELIIKYDNELIKQTAEKNIG